MAKPKKRFFIVSNSSPELDYNCVGTREEVESTAAMIAADSDEYIFVAELISTHWQNRDSESAPYTDSDALVNKHE